MAWGFFSRGARVTGQTATNIATQAGTYTAARVGGGTRTERVFHTRYVDFFKRCIRVISPRKHRFLSQGTDSKQYLLSRKNDAGNIRLNLVGRLGSPARGAAALDAMKPGAATDSAAAAGNDSAGPVLATDPTASLVDSTSPEPAPTPKQRVDMIGARAPHIQQAREQLAAQDPQTRQAGRTAELRLVAEILQDLGMLADPSLDEALSEVSSARRESAVEQLTRQLIALKMPEGTRALQSTALSSGDASGVETDESRRALDQRYQHFPAKTSGDETLESQKLRGNALWPSPAGHPDAFVEQLGQLLTRLASPQAGASSGPASAHLIDQLFNQARIQAGAADGAPNRTVDALDALYHTRQLLWMLGERGQHGDYDAQLKRNLGPLGAGELERRLPLARLQAYCEDVDRLFGANASLDESRLNLKLTAATNDGERELIKRQHALGLSMRSLSRAWAVQTRHGSGLQSPFVQGSRVRLDEAMLKALTPGRASKTSNSVQSANTRDINLLVAHAIALQKAADDQTAWLEAGETSVVAEPARDDGASNTVKALFDKRDLSSMGFADAELDRMSEDGSLDELLDAARALASVGLQGSRDVAAVNRLLAGARDRLIDNSLANKGLRELVGAGARAEALVAIARTTAATRDPVIAGLGSWNREEESAKQRVEYDRAGAAIANAYDDRVEIDRSLAEARQTLKAMSEPPSSLVLDPSDRKTREAALQLQEFRELAAMFESIDSLSARLEAAIAEQDDGPGRQSLQQDHETARGQLAELRAALDTSRAALARRAEHPLLAPHAAVLKGDSLVAATQWVRAADTDAASTAAQTLAAADAIATIDAAPDRIKLCESRMREAARVQTRILEKRSDWLPDTQQAALRLELRSIAAGLYVEHLNAAAAAGEPPTEYILANDRERFIERARDRGFPVDAFAIEIDDLLVRELSEEALGSWISDTQQTFTDRLLTAMSEVGASTAALRGMPPSTGSTKAPDAPARVAADTPTLANANRAALLGAVRQMQIGDRVFLKASRTGEIGLSKIPVDPSGTLKLDMMAGGGDRNVFDVKRKPNGNYTISIREGSTLSVRAGISASPAALAQVVKLSGKVQATHTEVAGFALEFPPEHGIAFIEHILENKPVDAKLLSTAKDIRAISKEEDKLMLEGSLGVSSDGIAKAIEKHSPEAAKALRAGLQPKGPVLPSLGVTGKAVWSRAWAEAHQSNSRVVVLKRATAYQSEFGVSVGLSGKHPSLAEDVLKPGQAPEGKPAEYDPVAASLSSGAPNLATVQAAVSRVYEAELALEQQAFDGSLRKAEFEFVVPLVPGLDTAALGGVDSRLRAQLDRLPSERRAEFDELLKKVDLKDGYVLLASSQLDDAERDALNAEFGQGREMARDLGIKRSVKAGADALEKACTDHGERMVGLAARASDFKLQRLILVKGAFVTHDQAFNIGLARLASQGQAGTGNTVGQVDLTASPAAPQVPVVAPSDAGASIDAGVSIDAGAPIGAEQDQDEFFDAAGTYSEVLARRVPKLDRAVQAPDQVQALLDALGVIRGQPPASAASDPVALIRAGLQGYAVFGAGSDREAFESSLVRQLNRNSLLERALWDALGAVDRQTLLTSLRAMPDEAARRLFEETDMRIALQAEDTSPAAKVAPSEAQADPEGSNAPSAESVIRDAGFSPVPVAGDGHCMFASLAHAQGGSLRTQFQADSLAAAMEVRGQMMLRIASLDPAQIAMLAGSGDIGRQQSVLSAAYLELARGFNVGQPAQDGWGTALSLPLAAVAFNRPLVVLDEYGNANRYLPDGTAYPLDRIGPQALAATIEGLRTPDGQTPMLIYKSGPAHFQSVLIPS